MKLNVSVGTPSIHGYLNVDPLGGEGKHIANPKNLEGIVEDAECTEILAEDILDFISANEMMEFLKYYTRKLRHGGTLIIGGTDLFTLCKAIVTKQLNAVEANYALHGQQRNVWQFKYGQITLNDLCQLIEGLGLVIQKKRLNGFKMVVEATRP